MGTTLSTLQQSRDRVKTLLDNFVDRLDKGPDMRVNQAIVTFCSVRSLDNLRQHYEKRKLEAGDSAEDWIKSLAGKLGDLTSVPYAAGLGALAVAIIIDITSRAPAEESTKDALRSVFAEEKASEVWDQIDECLKRCVMNVNNRAELQSDLKRIECQLSTALTKLKNSMVRDGEMTPQALKAWVNGAAFHVEMLIHMVRIRGIQTCDPVERLLSAYQSDLDTLFSEHRAVTREKCHLVHSCVCMDRTHRPKSFCNEKGKQYEIADLNEEYFGAYYNHTYFSQKREIEQHFTKVRENLPTLVGQGDSFTLQ
ncbi:uncharacterized protein [Centroberyx affinis]|uniref:uncharacterized protein n=1 Tax=Centroberyx affinis TaxID=166261 RepID=UPI003A5BA4FD